MMAMGTHEQKMLDDIEGWISDEEAALLYQLATRCTGRGVIVEIGSWKGKSTICLGKGTMQGQHVPIYAVDPHLGGSFEEFQANIARAGIEELVTPIVEPSEQAAHHFDQPIELLFVDGSHYEEAVYLDYDLWVPKVIEGGIVAFHDTIAWAEWDGPRKLVEERIFPSAHFRRAYWKGSITVAEKVANASYTDRARNMAMFAAKKGYEATVLHTPQSLKTMAKTMARKLLSGRGK
jgi:predicted O-methyltransferase YrrM